jgi:UDP-glucose-4-epimerase GalE
LPATPFFRKDVYPILIKNALALYPESIISKGMSKTILVTGGAGYIGGHACKALSEAGFAPVVYDDLSAGRPERVQWGPLEQGDIRDAARLEQVFAAHKPLAVMHFAARISVGDSVADPAATYDVNVGGTVNLLKAMRAHGVNAIVFSSTAATYGTPESTPIPESAPKKPINPYGRSKLMMEQLLADFHAAYGLRYAALRYFNAAGATLEAGLGYLRPDPTHLVPLAMQALLGLRPPLSVYGTDYPTPDGTAIRDYLHVADLADAHVLALRHLLDGTRQTLTLNLGTSRGASVREVLNAVKEVTGSEVPHTLGPRRAGDPAILVADASAAHAALGWTPTRSSLARIIADDHAWHQTLVS